MSKAEQRFDAIVIGSGVAGLTFALDLADRARVCVMTKRDLCDTNTSHAQGGIAAVLSGIDTFDQHVQDTLVAGAGLCREEVVRVIVENGPAAIDKLLERGVALDQGEQGQLQLTREGGHSERRIAHAADATGAAVQQALVERAGEHPNITILEHHHAVDLITRAKFARGRGRGTPAGADDRVLGVYALDVRGGKVRAYASPVVCLATGGSGRAYAYTTNPDIATGDGVAMAYRRGARVANLEFVQFHPTLLYHPRERHFLISEALRGEGGILRNSSGERFMPRYDERLELAPRDIVARAIDSELKSRGDESVFLDMTHLPDDFLLEHFPTIHATCMKVGIDMRTTPIPVVPGAHYQCGGVLTDTYGRTNLHGLLAIGEVACTGLHGANRLASNSLLEGAVISARAAESALELADGHETIADLDLPGWDAGDAITADEGVLLQHSWDEIRRLMWNYVGIVRSNRRLRRARSRLDLIYAEVRDEYWRFLLTPALIELRNLAMVARLVVESALRRQESRGLHCSLDYPDSDDTNWAHDTVMRRSRFD